MNKNKTKQNLKIALLLFIYFCLLVGSVLLLILISNTNINYLQNLFKQSNFAFLPIVILFIFFYVSLSMYKIIFMFGSILIYLARKHKFAYLNIFKIHIYFKNKKIKVRRCSAEEKNDLLLMIPKKPHENCLDIILLNLGGHIFTLAFSLIFYLFGVYTHSLPFESMLFDILSVVFLARTIFELIPVPSSTEYNDILTIYHLLKSKDTRNCYYNLQKISEQFINKIPLKDMPENLFYNPYCNYEDNNFCSKLIILSFDRALSQLDFETTEKIGNYALSFSSPFMTTYKPYIQLQLLFCEILKKTDEQIINQKYTLEIKNLINNNSDNISILRINYAYELLTKNNIDNANIVLEQFRKNCSLPQYKDDVETEQNYISYINNIYYS